MPMPKTPAKATIPKDAPHVFAGAAASASSPVPDNPVDQMRAAFRMVHMAYGIWDPVAQALLEGGEGLAELVGLPPDQLFNNSNSFFNFIHAQDRGRFWSIYHTALRDAPGYEREYRIIRVDGSVRHVAEAGYFERDASGRAVRLLFTVQDITARKMAEEKLRLAKAQAELGSHAKSQFLAHMSHELRTPLNAIIGFSDVMRRQIFGGLGNERYVAYIDHIYESGAHLLVLINGILDLAKVEAGKARLEEEPIDLAAAIATCINTVRLRAEAGGVDLLVDLPEKWFLQGDHVRIKQIILNLLTNAVKFTGRGGTVRVFGRRKANGDLQMAVADTGRGIRQEDIARAMAPFEQLETAYTRSHEGTGLGLPLAKALAELHGGQLEIASALGVGTTVTVTFPAARVIEQGSGIGNQVSGRDSVLDP